MNNSEKMLSAIEAQDLVQAEQWFEKALLEDSDSILLDLAEYLESIGFFLQAKRIYNKLAPLYPQVNINLAAIASEDGDLEEAFGYLEEISSNDPWYVNALLIKADLYQMEGLPDVAREKLVEASQLSDDSIIAFGMAEIDFELGNFTQAIKEYASLDNRMIYEQTGISTYQRIGVSYASLGKFEAAIEFLQKAIEIEYDESTVFELAVILYDQEDYQKANLYFKQLDTLSPDFEGYEYIYALSLHADHQAEAALLMAQQGLNKNPFDSQLALLASQVSYELHDTEKAESYLLDAWNNADDLEEIALRLTNLYLEQERYEDILALEDQDWDNVLTRWNIARSYQALEDIEKAQELYGELHRDLRDNPEFLEEYIYLLRECGELERAKQEAQHYLSLVPDDSVMQEFYNSLDY
ncbi:tetratricopeptide repeat protein [Streptococcus gordonii]|uniref:tetratricopeptide repeat protein n=1 Tax=Streptococcus gordonii TaxID=1302 RepID=UPI00189BB90D|nr:tetratricopeptide repeat protein [Streptococcus gordonii]MCB6584721.1 tetratricopeptide repeat protein [Streptococcus gordonii]MCB7053655.1 tetratricopeptide repeat protein [Streptococcus gordonii]MCB7055741.1 tetratricopeptide repeat protein [Streptococcus gordonii]MCG4842783.1 tetratricopeptide repeat protein [Streptococcus gordonii]MCY7131988.1 tetratricopeptide repeat protein [Streptococcus gordonii]